MPTPDPTGAAAPFPAREQIDEGLVRRLIGDQHPQWSHLAVEPVRPGGNDHRTFRLGDGMLVRLPSAPGYVPQVEKEQTWLPRLAPRLPLPVPSVLGTGTPSPAFPAPWSVYGWIAGRPPTAEAVRHDVAFARDLARFLVALRSVDPTGAPGPGLHSAFRGGPVEHWAEEMDSLLHRVSGVERRRAEGLWRDACVARTSAPPVWVHGDVSRTNLLVRDGRLAAVLDLGCAAVGDPACDTVARWTMFRGEARRVFVHELAVDEGTWARGRGWALWKALIMLTNLPPGQAEFGRSVLDELLTERWYASSSGGPAPAG